MTWFADLDAVALGNTVFAIVFVLAWWKARN